MLFEGPKSIFSFISPALIYCTLAIISRGLYIFYAIYHCSLYCRAVSITDNFCTKEESLQFRGLKSRYVSNQEQFIMGHIRKQDLLFYPYIFQWMWKHSSFEMIMLLHKRFDSIVFGVLFSVSWPNLQSWNQAAP